MIKKENTVVKDEELKSDDKELIKIKSGKVAKAGKTKENTKTEEDSY